MARRSSASRSRSWARPRPPPASPASTAEDHLALPLLSGGLAGLAGTIEVSGPIGQIIPVISPGYGFTAIIVAFLGRLHRWGSSPPASWWRCPISAARTPRSRSVCRRVSPACSRACSCSSCSPRTSSSATASPRSSRAGRSPQHEPRGRGPRPDHHHQRRHASLLAGIGELVVERSGVLNLGVEGMMLAGAVTAFAVAFATGSYTRASSPPPWPALLMALIFGVLTLTLVSNQVATGLALTCSAWGSAPCSAPASSARRSPLAEARHPRPVRPPGPRAGPVRSGRPGLPLGGPDARRRVVPQAHAAA